MNRRVVELARRAIETAAHPFGTLIRVATDEPVAALTFDDGPHPEWTPRALDALERGGAKATFFMVGKAAARHPELVARVAGAGHAVANHSWDHTSLPLLRRRGRRAQIRWCEEALHPHGVRLFRPPFGHQSPASHLDAVRLGYDVVGWNLVAGDFRGDSGEAIAARVLERIGPGSIVLLHDALFSTQAEAYRDRAPMLEALDRILRALRDRLALVTLPELLARGRPRRWPWYRAPDLSALRSQI